MTIEGRKNWDYSGAVDRMSMAQRYAMVYELAKQMGMDAFADAINEELTPEEVKEIIVYLG